MSFFYCTQCNSDICLRYAIANGACIVSWIWNYIQQVSLYYCDLHADIRHLQNEGGNNTVPFNKPCFCCNMTEWMFYKIKYLNFTISDSRMHFNDFTSFFYKFNKSELVITHFLITMVQFFRGTYCLCLNPKDGDGMFLRTADTHS